jgi:hypothetical protein
MDIFAVFGTLFEQWATIADILRYVWFFLIPPFMWWAFKFVWDDYIGGVWIGSVPYDLVELIPPGDTEKSPHPMELVYAAIQGVFKGLNSFETLCQGQMIMPYSFEMAGIDGQVHFFVRVETQYRGLFEANMYAQYPNVQIIDAEDYTDSVPKLIPNKEWNLWGSDIELVEADQIPIKTWPHFEEDVTGKMIDPLSGLIELMGRTKRGEQFWLQLISMPVSEAYYKECLEFVDEMRGKAKPKPKKGFLGNLVYNATGFIGGGGGDDGGGDDGVENALEFRLSPTEKKVLQAVEENIGRYMFQVKMRFIYLGRKEVFDGQMIAGLFGAMKQFSDFNLNGFKPDNKSKTKAEYAFKRTRLRFKQRQLIERYRKRKMSGVKFYLSDREMATIYHMPDMSVVAPAIQRSSAGMSSAPANLPIDQ